MKALRWYGKRDLRFEDVPEPFPGPGQIKVKINRIGICGSDLQDYASGSSMIPAEKVPLIIGHEFSGHVVDSGKGASIFSVGDRVTGLGYWACHECFFCKRRQYNLCLNSSFTGMNVDGCMAEYLVAPENTFYQLPDSVSDDRAVLVEPLSVALHAVRLSKIVPGDTVTIVGDGTIGLSVLLLARIAGASRIFVVAKHRNRGEIAKDLGASGVIYLQEGDPVTSLRKLTEGHGSDVSFECAGRPDSAQLAVDLARRSGTIVILGIFHRPGLFDFNTLGLHQKTVIGSPIYVDEAAAVISYLADGRLNPDRLVTARVPFKDAIEMGFEYQLAHKEQNIKVLLDLS